jgi:polyisoprenoid-binding protein YceI
MRGGEPLAVMKHTLRFLALAVVFLLLAWRGAAAQGPAADASALTVTGGAASFEVSTNVLGTMVRGKSSALTASTLLRSSAAELILERLEATLPVASLKTGIKLRDQHMVKYIFQTADGQQPDLHFTAGDARCVRADSVSPYSCAAAGMLTIRGTPRPFSITLEVTPEGSGYHVKGDGKVTLTSYGIERPSQFGVRTGDEVRLHLEFSARAASPTSKTSVQ